MTPSFLPNMEQSHSDLKKWNGIAPLSWLSNQTHPEKLATFQLFNLLYKYHKFQITFTKPQFSMTCKTDFNKVKHFGSAKLNMPHVYSVYISVVQWPSPTATMNHICIPHHRRKRARGQARGRRRGRGRGGQAKWATSMRRGKRSTHLKSYLNTAYLSRGIEDLNESPLMSPKGG
jgi:hypothetical protein